MTPDLKGLNVFLLEFSTEVQLNSDIVRKIRDASNPDEEGDSVFFDSYKGHTALAVVYGAGRDTQPYRLIFRYTARSGGRLSKDVPRITQLFDILSDVKEQLSFECSVSFDFGKALHPRPLITLPVECPSTAGMPFDRIQGLHFVKLDGNGTKYDVFLEAPARGIVRETVEFKYVSPFEQSVPQKILLMAQSISDKFVFKERKDGGEAG